MSGQYEYKGYTYRPWDEHQDDCIKTYHEVFRGDEFVTDLDWSPYRVLTEENFRRMVDLNFPFRTLVGSCAPLNEDDLHRLFMKKEHVVFLEEKAQVEPIKFLMLLRNIEEIPLTCSLQFLEGKVASPPLTYYSLEKIRKLCEAHSAKLRVFTEEGA